MKLTTRLRLNLYLAATFLLVFCTSSAVLYRSLVDGAVSEVKRESVLRMEMALAVREYTIKQVRPALEASGLAHLLPAVPAHAAIQTMALLEKDHPGYRYREVAFNPISAANRPTEWEAEFIEAFRADPEQRDLTRLFDEADGPVLRIARPVRPTPDCLGCHGEPAAMPPALQQRYEPRTAAWLEGETVGAQIVSVPMAHALAQARSAWAWHVVTSLVVFGTLFVVLNRLLRRTVIAPIETSSGIWRDLASKDALTGALNRRGFEEQGADLVAAAAEENAALALVVMDIDHFKRINDSFGHAAGDEVLKEFARRILQTSKRRDSLYRIGGEEFALLLPHTDLVAAARFAESLRFSMEVTPCRNIGHITASFGVAAMMQGDRLDTLMQRADRALYAAKSAGRNRVVATDTL